MATPELIERSIATELRVNVGGIRVEADMRISVKHIKEKLHSHVGSDQSVAE